MRALKVKNGVVANVGVFDKLPKASSGWKEAPEGVGIGWADNGDGTFSAPIKPDPGPPTVAEQIATIERTVTKHDMMKAVLGDVDASAKIQDVSDQVDELIAQ